MSSSTVNLPNELPDFLRRQRARRSPISKMNWPADGDETAYARRSAAHRNELCQAAGTGTQRASTGDRLVNSANKTSLRGEDAPLPSIRLCGRVRSEY
jgi:hypothetical protein